MKKMDRHKFFEEISLLLSSKQKNKFDEVVDSFKRIFETIDDGQLPLYAEETVSINNRRNLRANILDITNEIISKGSRAFYKSVFILESSLEEIVEKYKSNNNFIDEYMNLIHEFQVAYDFFIQKKQESNFMYAAYLANDILIMERVIKEISSEFFNVSEKNDSLENNKLEIYLSNVENFDLFSEKLKCFSNIHKEVLRLNKLSDSDSPLKIEYIESGSLSLKVIFGSVVVTKLMTSIIDIGVDYYHENYTFEGGVAKISKSSDEIDKILKLSEKLKADGVDTVEINDVLNNSLVKIAKNLDVLIKDQPQVFLNGNEKSIDSNLVGKFLEQTKRIEKL